jgi:hypothetical protein
MAVEIQKEPSQREIELTRSPRRRKLYTTLVLVVLVVLLAGGGVLLIRSFMAPVGPSIAATMRAGDEIEGSFSARDTLFFNHPTYIDYELVVSHAGRYRIELAPDSPEAAAPAFSLLDEGDLLSSGDASERSVVADLQPGTYIVRVHRSVDVARNNAMDFAISVQQIPRA